MLFFNIRGEYKQKNANYSIFQLNKNQNINSFNNIKFKQGGVINGN
jgi:hypothetical protein